ncbi:MAG: ATP-binding protein [Nitrospiria bacterium]
MTVEFSDTGKGIPHAHLKDVFKPFFTTKRKGMGIGLSLAKRVLERLSGTIELISGEGCGTTVRINLPLSR